MLLQRHINSSWIQLTTRYNNINNNTYGPFSLFTSNKIAYMDPIMNNNRHGKYIHYSTKTSIYYFKDTVHGLSGSRILLQNSMIMI